MDKFAAHLSFSLIIAEKEKNFKQKGGFSQNPGGISFVESDVEKKWKKRAVVNGKTADRAGQSAAALREKSYPPKIPHCGKRKKRISTSS